MRLTSRRSFLTTLAMLGVAGRVLLRTGDVRGAIHAARDTGGEEPHLPAMPYRTFGRTGFRGSRLVFGCGAALARRRHDALLDAAFDAGINVFDVGFRGYYHDAEHHLAPFVKRVRDRVFLISKAIPELDVAPGDPVTAGQAKVAAASWLVHLDASLRELEVDRVDAYYVMAAHNPAFIASEELYEAFQRTKRAGKVAHLGLSTHRNAEAVLAAAARTGWYDLAMIAVTPAGWYDWETKGILAGSRPMAELETALAGARAAGIGLIGMKAGRHLAGRGWLGASRPDAFDEYYDESLRRAALSAFQRSYAFVLGHGLDAVNADMQSIAHLHENIVAAAASTTYFA